MVTGAFSLYTGGLLVCLSKENAKSFCDELKVV